MWSVPKPDLKLRLTVRVVAVSTLCFLAAATYILVEGAQAARVRIEAAADTTARDLALQQSKMSWVFVNRPPPPFPDLQGIAAALAMPGLCIGYRAPDGRVLQRICTGARNGGAPAPDLFSALYGAAFEPGREAVRPVALREGAEGAAVAWIDTEVRTQEAWQDTRGILAAMVGTLVLLGGLVHAALAQALRPTRQIRDGLERIAAGDLSTRLPSFDLAELSAVGRVFNHLAASLERTVAERNTLSRRLIDLQDDERRHLARELHDEFGQCLAGIRALAASAGQTAAQDGPAVLAECQGIERTAARMAESLRGTLLRLRPPDVEELGLSVALQGLAAGWNGRGHGGVRVELHLGGGIDGVPAAVALTLYRIAQEAITNASKHGGAAAVLLRLSRSPADASGASGASGAPPQVVLVAEDDGRPATPGGGTGLGAGLGLGLLGVRERVAALGGRVRFDVVATGTVLEVAIPLPPPGTARSGGGRP